MVILLTEWLQAQGQRVAVLSRGYKRESTAAHVLVSDGRRVLVGPAEAGDEGDLLAVVDLEPDLFRQHDGGHVGDEPCPDDLSHVSPLSSVP